MSTVSPSGFYFAEKRLSAADGKPVYSHTHRNRRYVLACGAGELSIVQVFVRERTPEDPESPYWGWIDANAPDQFCMISPSLKAFSICFPYGIKAEEDRGKGRGVNLIVEEVFNESFFRNEVHAIAASDRATYSLPDPANIDPESMDLFEKGLTIRAAKGPLQVEGFEALGVLQPGEAAFFCVQPKTQEDGSVALQWEGQRVVVKAPGTG